MKTIILTFLILISGYFLIGNLSGCNAQGVIPNDPYFGQQKNLYCTQRGTIDLLLRSNSTRIQQINVMPDYTLNMPEVWGLTTGSKDVIVGLIESGFFYSHDDIKDNLWVNDGETGVDEHGIDKRFNGKDDDGNGYIDDLIGYDFAFRDPDPDCYSYDGKNLYRIQPYWHGINVAGVLGAVGNNGKGTAGVAWNVSLMLLKPYYAALDYVNQDTMKPFRYAEAIKYAVDNGARIINWSGTITASNYQYCIDKISEAFQYALDNNVLIVAGVGTHNKNLDLPENFEVPACLDLPNFIKVAELDFSGDLYSYSLPDGREMRSCWGSETVDVGVVATNFTTTVYHGHSTYNISGGGSCAAPVISGLAVLMLSANPELSAVQIKELILKNVKYSPLLKGKIKSEGTPDMYATVKAAMELR